jgi:hypothetical protein
MMEFTNKHNLPGWVHNGLIRNLYNKDNIRFDISCTKLLGSTQIAEFWRTHGKEVVEDSSTRIWSVLGTAIHEAFTQANASNPDVIMEKRFVHEIGGKMVAAQIDCYEIKPKILSDLKSCGTYKVLKGEYNDWTSQLNVGAELMRRSGYEIDKLEIVALLKDHSGMKAKMDREYPDIAIKIINIPLWSSEKTNQYILDRLEVHYSDDPKTCTNEERWYRPGKWAVMKPNSTRAARLLDTKEAAEKWAKSQLKGKSEIVERPTVYTRCESFCAFNQWCTQYQESRHGV